MLKRTVFYEMPLNKKMYMFEQIHNALSMRIALRKKYKLQYASDLHVDVHNKIPVVTPLTNNLAIAGDIGKPTHPNFSKFLSHVSQEFDNVYFVPGNHDYDCGPEYEHNKVVENKERIYDICENFNNVRILDNSIKYLDNNLIIAGTTLWSKPIENNKEEHIKVHNACVDWLSGIINLYHNYDIIVLSHFVPTFKLIEQKYKARGIKKVSWFATDLEHMINPPIKTWICGHTHSVISCYVNDIYCAINAHACKNDYVKSKYIEV